MPIDVSGMKVGDTRPIRTKKCPDCNTLGSLSITLKLRAKPLTEFSLAGAQLKVSATQDYWLSCHRCDFEDWN